MQEQLKVALIQSNLVWENPIQNRINFSKKIASFQDEVDLLILPEMFTTGFTMHPEPFAETMQGKTVEWLKETSKKTNAAIMGSSIILEDNHFYNRLLFVEPSGTIQYYDKRHTFTLAGEHLKYTAGKEQKIVRYKGWKMMLQICYDLRFPVFARNTMDYDVLVYVANWPAPRIAAWNALLKARAIENMSYCIGVNRVGMDANNLQYPGHSATYDLFGNKIAECNSDLEDTVIITLTKDHLKKYRERLQFLNDKDAFSLE